MHLCERFKTEVLRMSQEHYSMDVFSGCFEDVHKMILQNCMNMQQLIFQYFTQHIWWSKILICFVIYFQIGVLGTSRGRHFRTLWGRPWNVSPQFMSKWINLIVFASWWYAESTSTRGNFWGGLKTFLQNVMHAKNCSVFSILVNVNWK